MGSFRRFVCKNCKKRTNHKKISNKVIDGIKYSFVKCNNCKYETKKPLIFIKKKGIRRKTLTIRDVI